MKTCLILSLLIGGCLWAGCVSRNGSSKPTQTTSPNTALIERTDPVTVGTTAPDFELIDQDGRSFHLGGLKGKNVVLVFYPGDLTPGCTKQLCSIRDNWKMFKDRNIVVAGVNHAGSESHKKFVDQYQFPFPLLVDADLRVAAAYGCKGDNRAQRTVYGIDAKGTVVFAERGMPSDEKILAALKAE